MVKRTLFIGRFLKKGLGGVHSQVLFDMKNKISIKQGIPSALLRHELEISEPLEILVRSEDFRSCQVTKYYSSIARAKLPGLRFLSNQAWSAAGYQSAIRCKLDLFST